VATEPERFRPPDLSGASRSPDRAAAGDEVLVKRHDRHQFEVKLHLEVTADRRTDHYRVESYFFLPQSLDINERTYSKGRFYRDRRIYLRRKTPTLGLRELADPDEPRSPLHRLSGLLDRDGSIDDELAGRLDHEIRLFGCIVKSALRDLVRRAERSGGDPRSVARDLRRILGRFRELGERLRGLDPPARLQAAWSYTDEYVSLLVEWRVLQLLERIRLDEGTKEDPKPCGEGTAASLTRLVEQEIAYRKSAGYPTVLEDGEAASGELFVYRFGVLKKFVAQVLHLEMHTAPEGRGLREMALALAAGGAMLFATAVAFYYQRIYGTLSLGFFAALVVSYMFKDRIKALLQNALHHLLSRTLPDQTIRIRSRQDGRRIGTCSESVQFVEETHIDPEVRRLRNRAHLTEIENDYRAEKVLYYLKRITLVPVRFGGPGRRKQALTDILRFSVEPFLRRMDEPETRLKTIRDGCPVEVPARRVYHVNVVFKLVTPRRRILYERIRLVLDQNGIRRVEPVSSLRHPA